MKMIDRQAYFAKIDKKLEQAFSGTELQVARNIFKVMDSSYQVKNNYIRNIKKMYLDQDHLRDQDFFEPFLELTKVLLGTEYYERFHHFLNHKYEYPYSVGYYRRPFRTKNLIPHIEGIFDFFSNLFYLDMRSFNLMEYLTTPQDSWGYNHTVSDFLAYELDHDDNEVLTALETIIFGENNTALLSASMIKGIFKSHNKKAHKMLGDLFLAARLQEGIRQSIVENMDEGSPEAAIYFLKIIIDHNLIRYSSILRGLAVWTGLNLDAMKTRQAQQAIEHLYESLTDSEIRHRGFRSDNFNIIYISLWTTAFYEEEEIKPTIKRLMDDGAVYQKVAAQYFLSQSQNELLRFELSYPYLYETDLELLYYLLKNFCFEHYVTWPENGTGPSYLEIDHVSVLEDKQERTRLYERFRNLFLSLPKKEVTFESRVFQGYTLTLSSETIAKKMLYLMMYDLDQNWLGQLIQWKDKLSSDFRNILLTYFIVDFTNQPQRTFLFDSLSDKSMPNREVALAIVKNVELNLEEIEKVEAILKLKTGTLRQNAIHILLGLPSEKLDLSLSRLLNSRNELQRLGALEVMTEIADLSMHVQHIETVKNLPNLSQREQVLINKLIQTDEYTLENGFGLYDPNRVVRFEFERPNVSSLKDFLTLPLEAIQQLFNDLSNLVHDHRNVEYEFSWSDGSKETLHIGENLRVRHGEKENLDQLPLTELWRDFFNKRCLTPAEMIQIAFYLHSDRIFRYFYNGHNEWEWREYPKVEGWRKEFLEEIFPMELMKEYHHFFSDLKYSSQVETIFEAYFNEQNPEALFEIISDMLNFMIHCLPEEKCQSEMKLYELLSYPWLGWAHQFAGKEDNFDTYYKLDYLLYSLTEFNQNHRSTEELALALDRKLIDEDFVYRELMNRERISYYHIRDLTWPKKEIVKEFPFMKELRDKVVHRILEIELKRGDLPTDVTYIAGAIEHYSGMEYFVKILAGLENETFVRGYLSVYGNTSKKEMFSHLLKNCSPEEGDSGKKLAELLQGLNISEKRLLEAAMYAPQWLEIVENYLGWEGLRKAAWYFHAHINEFFTSEKEAVIALYSPISPQDFQDGAFDIDWFRESYEQVGTKRFGLLYQCAKYISGGANHRRSQLFADAVLGKLPLESTKNEAHQKRNKDKILAYSLIPVQNAEDVLERYEFLQQFLHESKKFGAQRRTSEAKTVDIALENLARNAGYSDVIRLKWDMEAQKMETVRPFLEPVEMDDITVQLAIDEYGMTEIIAVKNGKTLKSVPAKYNKLEYIVKLKELRTDLRHQFKRAKAELERSMMMESGFTLEEVAKLMENPVLAPLLEKLVLKTGEHLGYFNDGILKGCGHEYVIGDEDVLYIAHPVHLYESGLWSDFQRDLFARKVKQPFKQVFRELYLPNQDELATGAGWTRRYAGHQIQPKKAAALLKSRLWTVNYEEGLQKVYYKENIVVQLYAMADWFSPSDIECPTLETVDFFDRNTFKPLEIAKIPKHIFSETMRDIDLVVSVAHVGGVDPEASMTTIEMRKAIVAESVRLMKLDQVRVEGNFALVEGNLGEYSVHLGSGNVYKQATGAIFIVPVHSQQRGRVFLPFLDEDPKTAEIVSKILLLAEDKKIKDPFILEQIKG